MPSSQDPLARRNRRLSACLLGLAAGMVGLAYASAPLYDLFCRMTGFGGTTQVAAQAPGAAGERRITVRFNADVHPRLPWRFQPTQSAVSVRLGEPGLTAYHAESRSAQATVGTATFNVTPDKMGKYFSKTAFALKSRRWGRAKRRSCRWRFLSTRRWSTIRRWPTSRQ